MSASVVSDDRSARPLRLSRRRFLKLAGATAAAAAAETLGPAGVAEASAPTRVEELAREHAGDPALLIDLSKCVGCGACVSACKLENDLEWRQDQPCLGPQAELASANWTTVKTVEPARGARGTIRYVKSQCMHCLEPACVSACPVRALRKQPVGAVTYDANRCIGCRYCLMACPFEVPTFEWDRAISKVSKCDLCFDRVSRGEATACAAACPVGAIVFGRRGGLLAAAKQRIAAEPDRYEPGVYGETEAGGTSVLFISDVPFAALGLPQGIPDRPLPDFTWPLSRLVPPVGAGLGALLVALYVRRRRILLEGTGERDSEPEPTQAPGRAPPATGRGRPGPPRGGER